MSLRVRVIESAIQCASGQCASGKPPRSLLAILEVVIITTSSILLLTPTAQAARMHSLKIERAETTIAMTSAQTNEATCSSSEIAQAIERLESQIIEATAILIECNTAATTPLIQLLEDEHQDTLRRRAAAKVLSQIGSQEAIAALVRVAQQESSGIRDSALRAIADINPQARDAVPTLIDALQHEDELIWTMAAYALGQLRENAREAVPALLEMLDDRSANVRASAVDSLRQIALDNPSVIRSIVSLSAAETDLTVLNNAVEALQQLSPTTLPTLLEIIAFDGNWRDAAIVDAWVNLFDLQTLPQLTDKESLTLIPAALRRYSEFPKAERASMIAYLSRQLTPSVISRLVAILEDEDQDIRLRGNAAMAIGVADLESPLIAILEDKSQDKALRADAATALGFTNGSPAATASLIEFVRSSRAYQAGLHLSSAESQEYLSSEVLSSEFNLIFASFLSLQGFSDQDEVDSFFVQFRQENPTLFYEMVNLRAASGADGSTLVRLLQERSQTPAICRVSFMQRFLWRCR